MQAVAIKQKTGGWVLWIGEERIGWWYDWNALFDYADRLGFQVREVI